MTAPLCWWCEKPARRRPLVEHPGHPGVMFHPGACRRAFDANNRPAEPRQPEPRDLLAKLAPLRR